MLAWYKQSDFTLPVTAARPKRLLFPLQGGSKDVVIYLHNDGTTNWKSIGNIKIYPYGPDMAQQLQVAVHQVGVGGFGFPGMPYTYTSTTLAPGASIAIAIRVTLLSGPAAEFTNLQLITAPLYERTVGDNTAIAVDEIGVTFTAYLDVIRAENRLSLPMRLLPPERKVEDSLPGLVVGQYRWRDNQRTNACALVPTQWDPDIALIGADKFIDGIGDTNDLEPVDLEEDPSSDSLFPRIRRGCYFMGPERYYLTAGNQLEFYPATAAHPTAILTKAPIQQIPIYVGNWYLDSDGFYHDNTAYHYSGTAFDTDLDAPVFQYTLDRHTRRVTLNQPVPSETKFLGVVSGAAVDYFDLPVHPIARLLRLYIDRGLGADPVPVNLGAVHVDYEQGALTITGSGPSVAGALPGEPVMMEYEPAFAVLYESSADDTRLLPVDINPAFSGLSSGYIYLQHRRPLADSLNLTCDKPILPVPVPYQSILGLQAYGPVYYGDDYATLIAKAYTRTPGEPAPNATLQVEIQDSSTWNGLINYIDPLTNTIQVKTGGDGIANLIYTPTASYGTWLATSSLATTSLANDTLVLPDFVQRDLSTTLGIPLTQLYNSDDGWLCTTYLVRNDNPTMGMAGGDASAGQVVWATTGTAGQSSYRTNGQRVALRLGPALILPSDALDNAGVSYTAGGFSGVVRKLVFSQALPTDTYVGAYFITYVQRVRMRLTIPGTNVASNSILLEMQPPMLIDEDPWLRLDHDVQGRLNQYRLGWIPSQRQI